MRPLKAFISLFPGGKILAERHSYWRRNRRLKQIGNAEERFTSIYEENKWRDGESRSGAGSSLKATESIRKKIPALINSLGVKIILDVPCGDYNWIQHMEWFDEIRYIGGDIVKSLVDKNQQEYGDKNTSFAHINLTKGPLPAADLLLCRDCLVHLCYDDIDSAIRNFMESGIRYLLTTTHPAISQNIDIPTGHFRTLNLQIPPFEFCEPLEIFDDFDTGPKSKRLALWGREQLEGLIH